MRDASSQPRVGPAVCARTRPEFGVPVRVWEPHCCGNQGPGTQGLTGPRAVVWCSVIRLCDFGRSAIYWAGTRPSAAVTVWKLDLASPLSLSLPFGPQTARSLPSGPQCPCIWRAVCTHTPLCPALHQGFKKSPVRKKRPVCFLLKPLTHAKTF